MNCAVEYPDVFSQTRVRRSRVNRVCEDCDGRIERGTPYDRTRTLYDGRWSTYATCPDCDALRCEIMRTAKRESCGLMFPDLRMQLSDSDFIDESDFPGGFDDLARIVAAFNATATLRGAAPLSNDALDRHREHLAEEAA